MTPVSHPLKTSPISPDLQPFLPNPKTPWEVSSPLFKRIKSHASHRPFETCEVLNSDAEFKIILKSFEDQKPAGYSIKKIVCIHNPDQTIFFESGLKNMERESNNPFFIPRGKDEEPRLDRAKVLARWEQQTAPFSPIEIKGATRIDICQKAKVLPLWHGGSQEICDSVGSVGFTSFGKHHYFDPSAFKGGIKNTDKGYFGSGIYFTNSARYAKMYSSDGLIFLAWVSMREPYPVVSDVPHPKKSSDMTKLEGKEHYQNYNAHYIPVASISPLDPHCMQYYPCYKDQTPTWDEYVVFNTSQALPRFWIELSVDFPLATPITPVNIRELVSTIKTILENQKLKNDSNFVFMLQSKLEKIKDLSPDEPLDSKNLKFFEMAKRLMVENEKKDTSKSPALLKIKHQPIHFSHGAGSSPGSVSNSYSIMENVTTEEAFKWGQYFSSRKDYGKAVKYYHLAAQQDHAEAQYQLGSLFFKGLGVEKNKTVAVQWYQKASAKDCPLANYYLGSCLLFGNGIESSPVEGIQLYFKAAQQGVVPAQYYLGMFYLEGNILSQDSTKALEWFRKAAAQGDADAKAMVQKLAMQ